MTIVHRDGKTVRLALQDHETLSGHADTFVADGSKSGIVGPPIGAVPTIPQYLNDVYFWAYINERNQRILDHQFVVSTILWGNARRLTESVLEELRPGDKVLQPASVYGTFCADIARHVGREGRLDVIDIVPSQVEISRRKLEDYPHATARVADARKPGVKGYDAVACYFLLHEVPDDYKHDITNALLDSVKPGGKAVFVDYHRPNLFHPLRPMMSLILDQFEPYAKALWSHEIADYATRRDDYDWSKETSFGGLYQKVVAIRSR